MADRLHKTDLLERAIYHEICCRDGVKARELEKRIPADKHRINQYLYGAPFAPETCFSTCLTNTWGFCGSERGFLYQ